MNKRFEHQIRGSIWACAFLGALFSAGCLGVVNSDAENHAGPPGSSTGSTTSTGGASGTGSVPGGGASGSMPGGAGTGSGSGTSACVGQTGIPAAMPARRLTRAEYNASVAVLLGDTTSPATNLPPELIGNLFSNDSAQQPVSADLVSGYNNIAEDIAARATTGAQLATLAPCAANATSAAAQDTCAQTFIQSFGSKAYRRPLAADEVADLLTLEKSVTAAGTFASGLAAVVEAMLQAPDFLYRIEVGVPDPANPAQRRPSGDEMATRLSFLFWGVGPDDALRTAAASGELLTADGVLKNATRLLADDRSHAVVKYFFDSLFPITTLTDQARDATLYPKFSPQIGSYMRQETETFLQNEIFNGKGTWPSVLTADYTYVNGPLAAYYGISGVTGNDFQKVQLDTTKRMGLLTQGAVMTGTTVTNSTNPVLRGSFVVNKLMCLNISLPSDPGLLAQVKVPDNVTGTTARQRFSAHSSQPVCHTCHALMDPIGFALENYDAVGQYRTQEGDQTIDASGKIPDVGTETHQTVVGGVQLAQQLAESETAQRCFAQHWLEYGYGRTLKQTPEELCLQEKLNTAFKASGYNVKQLLLDLTQTPAFLYMPSEG
jgi:Protein of unknown function (DUF1592)/Protein of unknown function (DUF1588)/Protein of unknown function (DUF1595)/Protein of unknown function (DUF1585)/Protein of unknown function (DUF1587)